MTETEIETTIEPMTPKRFSLVIERLVREKELNYMDAILYYCEELDEGYKASTIAQIAGRMTKESNQYKYSVQSESAKNGCYIICKTKS